MSAVGRHLLCHVYRSVRTTPSSHAKLHQRRIPGRHQLVWDFFFLKKIDQGVDRAAGAGVQGFLRMEELQKDIDIC